MDAAPVPGLRVVRVLATGTAAASLGIGAHLAGGGTLPGFLPLLPVLLAVLGVAALTTRGRPSPVATGVGVLVAQGGLHLALSALSPGPAASSTGLAARLLCHGAGAAPLDPAALPPGLASLLPAPAAPSVLAAVAMAGAHLVAAVLLAAWLHRSDRLLLALVTAVTRRLQTARPLALPALRRPWSLTPSPGVAFTARLLESALRRRGPPAPQTA